MNVTIGMATGYSIEELRPFVLSVKRHFSGKAILIVDAEADTALLDWLLERDVEPFPFAYEKMHPVLARFFAYKSLLAAEKYEYAFLTDVRDVFAQSDIFASCCAAEGLHVFEEMPNVRLRDSTMNTQWLASWYGKHIAESIGSNPICNVGTVFGDRSSLDTYLRLLLGEFKRLFAKSEAAPGAFGLDMAAHNYLCFSGLLRNELRKAGKPLHMQPNGSGVFTSGLTDVYHIRRDGLIVNADGSVPAVIHQYDRHAFIKRMVEDMYNL